MFGTPGQSLVPEHLGAPKITAVSATKGDYDAPAMGRGLAVLLTAAVGGVLALQAPINAGLGRVTGNLPAALVSFSVGTLALALIVGLSGDARGLAGTFDVRWYYLIGGLLGALYVFMALTTVSTIGAGGVASATITGQLAASVIIDRFGIFGLDETPITLSRLTGVVLLLAGTYLVVR
jgi:transporter family-2 protein